MIKRKGEITVRGNKVRREKAEQKEGDGYKRNINNSGVFQSIAVKLQAVTFLEATKGHAWRGSEACAFVVS